MNCLTHLLELFDRGHRFIILENGDHFIGVNDKKIFELGNSFKKDLQLGYSLNGGNNFIPIIKEDSERLSKSFKLENKYIKILNSYFR